MLGKTFQNNTLGNYKFESTKRIETLIRKRVHVSI